MAFSSRDLSVIGYANGFTLWHFKTSDPARRVGAESYFNSASHMFRIGDFIMVNAGIGSNPAHGLVVVVGIERGEVMVRQLSAIPGIVKNKNREDNFAL
jgi:hypothetical protein